MRCSRDIEVDLGDGIDAEVGDEVDEQSDLHSPALDERHRLEQCAPSRVLAGERLDEAREVGEQGGDERSGHELGHAAAAGGLAVERAAVVALHESDGGIGEQRFDQSGHEVRSEVAHIGVEPAHDVTAARVQRQPQRVALARAAGDVGEDLVDRDDPGALPACGFGSGVGRAVVDHDDLVDQRRVLHQVAADGRDDLSDRRLLVTRRQAHRDGGATGLLGGDERSDVELRGSHRTRVGKRASAQAGELAPPVDRPGTERTGVSDGGRP